MSLQAFLTEFSVEGLNKCVVSRFARSSDFQDYTPMIGSEIHLFVNTIGFLNVHRPALAVQHKMDTPTSISHTCLANLFNALFQRDRIGAT